MASVLTPSPLDGINIHAVLSNQHKVGLEQFPRPIYDLNAATKDLDKELRERLIDLGAIVPSGFSMRQKRLLAMVHDFVRLHSFKEVTKPLGDGKLEGMERQTEGLDRKSCCCPHLHKTPS